MKMKNPIDYARAVIERARLTPDDVARIDAAMEKRKRKAAKRKANLKKS